MNAKHLEHAITKVFTAAQIKSLVEQATYDVGSGDTVTGQACDWTWVAAALADQLREAYEEAGQ